MSAAIAPTGEAALVQTIDVPYRVEVADAAAFFELANVAMSLADLVPHLTTLAPLQSSPNGGSAPDQATPDSRDGDASLPQPHLPPDMKECRVALQFPDELLFVSDAVVSDMFRLMDDLRERCDSLQAIQFDFVILADTQYSACCVDEVAAQHIAANVLVHFGRSCLSQASHMPVLFAFGNFPIDVDHVSQSLANVPNALVIYDVMYAHAMPTLAAKVAPTVRFAAIERHVSSTNGSTHYTRNLPTKEDLDADTTVVVIGPPSPLVSHYSLVFGQHSQLLHYDPLSRECSRPRSLLMKRYALMTKARDADIIGIVVGTLGVANYVDMIANLKKLIKSHGKKYYTFVLGKLNVAKLANFSEIDIFVLVACPESSLIDSKEFYRPVVTPFELTMALDMSSSWTGEYRLGFTDVMHQMAEHMGDEPVDGLDQQQTPVAAISSKPTAADSDAESDTDPDQPYFSLVTGTFKSRAKVENNETIHAKIQDLALYKSGQVALASPAAARQLQTRQWRGLEMTPSAEKSLEVVEGRFGTAAGYADEPEVETGKGRRGG
ncbi:diphthamide biosynthesis protein 2 [Allomyces macrogynus ATCC 38327]|uniref:2-(3-amino-3-carboxypropyl)histidine synthase subunit 2 n=1 Tax=Allomyces macrogynus (strain ATCC 38327) TaxID=578462 RepID=A0A0L0TEN5_ALLM3|nr:diphthamide biosynthesis protein 2 [Allomyces macrogynus ATCC 38327]|eukprot:KNE73121.1 diphthamide biosynthesis protein 2 [Allomyces macrogynus ATCC 38327]